MRPGINEWDEAILHRFFFPWDVQEILKIKLPGIRSPDWIAYVKVVL
jgi:hypothetical protein